MKNEPSATHRVQGMEQEGTIWMFLHPESLVFRYMNFVGEGYLSNYNAICKLKNSSEPYRNISLQT